MKNHFFLYFIFLFLVLIACDEHLLGEYEEIPPVDSFDEGSISLISLNPFRLEIKSEIHAIGDGILHYGNVWTTNTNEDPKIEVNSKTDFGSLDSAGIIISNLDPSKFEFDVDYNVATYATDIYGTTHYSQTKKFRKSYTFENDISLITGDNQFFEFDQPILVLNSGEYLISNIKSFQNGERTNDILKVNRDGTLNSNFKIQASSFINNWNLQAPTDMIQNGSEVLITGNSDININCGTPIRSVDSETGQDITEYKNKTGADFSQEYCNKIIYDDIRQIILTVCYGNSTDENNYVIYTKESKKPDDPECLDLKGIDKNEISYEAISYNENQIAIIGTDLNKNGMVFISTNNQYFYSNFMGEPIKVRKVNTPLDGYLAVCEKKDYSGITILMFHENFNFTNLTYEFSNYENLDIYDSIIFENGDFIVCGSYNGKGYLAKYVYLNNQYNLAWEKNDFESSIISRIKLDIDGGIIGSGRIELKLFIIKTDDEGNIL